MKFITVIVVLLIYRNWWGGNPVRDVVSVDGWFHWIEGMVSERKMRYVCAVIVPSLILFWVSIVTADWILGLVYLVLSVVTVLYAIECIDFDGIFDEYRLSVRSGISIRGGCQSEARRILHRCDLYRISEFRTRGFLVPVTRSGRGVTLCLHRTVYRSSSC